MCGIAGIIDLKSEREINRDVLLSMRDALIHRGPDEAGLFLEPGIGLAHRRLSIIDRAGGQQPLSNEQNTVTIVYNGEVYNYKELTRELQQLGYSFQTNSDTETILHAWEAWGEKCVQHLRGMFAFVIWDKNKNTVFLARDRLGIKPLLYATTDDGYLIFASEHKALLKHPSLKSDINIISIESYFALGYIAEPDTIYHSIRKLPAGYNLLVRDRKLAEPKQYWDVPFNRDNTSLNWHDAQNELHQRLQKAIEIRMIAEVPLGAFLSGGVDSSTVVALMSELSQDPVNTCSIGFDNTQFDESQYASQVAEKYKTNHYQESIRSDDFDLIDRLVDIYDEPYADSSALPTYRVCELARKRVTVALSGDGADELMSGYRRHKFHLREEYIRNLLPLAVRKPVFSMLANIYPKADWAPQWLRAKSTFQSLALDSVAAYFNTVSQNNDSVRNKLYSEQLKSKLNGFHALDIFKKHAEKAPCTDPQSLIQYIDLKTYLVDDILTKVDRASMANSLEVRVPILDHEFVEWISSIGNKFKFNNKTGKALLKKTMEPYLPDEILYRKKMGFSIPLASWFRGPLNERMRSSILSEPMLDSGWFNADYLSSVVSDHSNGLKDHGTLIWSLLIFDSFLKYKTQ